MTYVLGILLILLSIAIVTLWIMAGFLKREKAKTRELTGALKKQAAMQEALNEAEYEKQRKKAGLSQTADSDLAGRANSLFL